MKFKSKVLAILAIFLLGSVLIAAIVTGYKWNTVLYSKGKPVVSATFTTLDSVNSSQTDYQPDMAEFDNNKITVSTLFKAPANDTGLVVITGRTLVTGKYGAPQDIKYNCDSVKVIGAASYTYTPAVTNITLSFVAKEYSILFIPLHAAGGTNNRKNDTLIVTYTPFAPNVVPGNGYQSYYVR